jgi:cell division protein FtsB
LEQEKEQLRSERNAIEGLARYELGLIKPGETFYKFQSELTKDKEIDPKISNQDQ